MLAIKLQRKGKIHQPSYRVVVAPKRSKLGAPPVEDLGSYDSFTKTAKVNVERISHWLKVGAQPTPSVHNLLVRNKIISLPKIAVKVRKKKAEGETAPVAATAAGSSETATAGAQ